MDGESGQLTSAFPPAFWFLGELLFRWVPAAITAVVTTATTTPYANLGAPVSAVDVPTLLAQTSDPATFDAISKAWFVFSLITLTLSIPFLALVLYCWIRILQIRRRERLAVKAAQRTVTTQDIPRTQLRWNRVQDQASSSNPEGWRLAILEADIMLSELLDLQGYKGETIADKMKQVDRAQFNSIDAAWDAHKVRNRVAHEGDIIDLTPREVRRVIGLYNRVFKEFRYIE